MSASDSSRFLQRLDDEQRAAVRAPIGPVRVIAGAGTGKTTTLVHRIGYQDAVGTAPAHQVLAVTHSAKAAGNLRDRLAGMGVRRVQARTFHAAALRQLRHFWPAAGLPGAEPVLAASLRGGEYGLLREAAAPVLRRPARDIATDVITDLRAEVTWCQARRVRGQEYLSSGRDRVDGVAPQLVAQIADRYAAVKRKRAVLDFADVLEFTARLLETDESVAAQVRRTYRHLLVDEFQDTDPAQQRLVDAWLGTGRSLCVVGDPRQSIYGFKGAEPAQLDAFDRRFPDAVTVTLHRDYRSSPQVVAWANALMTGVRFAGIPADNLVGMAAAGPEPLITTHSDVDSEAAAVAGRVATLLARGVPAEEIAVLHPFNAQNLPLRDALTAVGVPTRDVDNEGFFDNPSVQAAVRALSAADPGQAAGTAARVAAAAAGLSPDAAPAPGTAVEQSQVFLAALVDLADGHGGTLEEWLTDLKRRHDSDHNPDTAAVTVTTIHQAKGLEWQAVLLPHWTEGSLPSVYATSPEQLAEQRRLAYVAVTRAKSLLFISHAHSGKGRVNRPSPWLELLPVQRRPPGRPTGQRTATPTPWTGPGPETLPVGTRVLAPMLGLGKVVGPDRPGWVIVDFRIGDPRRYQTSKLQLL